MDNLCISNYKDRGENENYCMVFEYADGGPLHRYLKKNSNRLTWCDKYTLAVAITNGLKYIHDHNIVHKDLVMCESRIRYHIFLAVIC